MPDAIARPAPEGASPDPTDPTRRAPGAMPDTSVANPLDPAAREQVADWYREQADLLEADLQSAPPADEIALAGDEDAWRERLYDGVRRLRADAAAIAEDVLAFRAASDIRRRLQQAESQELKAACAALEEAIAAVLAQRLALVREARAQRRRDAGFQITHVGGRGEPLATPGLTYTSGLDQHGHPELAIVGVDLEVAGLLLRALATEIVARQRIIRAGHDIDAERYAGFALRAIHAPAALVDVLGVAPVADVLQLLVPDESGRFPGDPQVDEQYEAGQRYPEHPGESR